MHSCHWYNVETFKWHAFGSCFFCLIYLRLDLVSKNPIQPSSSHLRWINHKLLGGQVLGALTHACKYTILPTHHRELKTMLRGLTKVLQKKFARQSWNIRFKLTHCFTFHVFGGEGATPTASSTCKASIISLSYLHQANEHRHDWCAHASFSGLFEALIIHRFANLALNYTFKPVPGKVLGI